MSRRATTATPAPGSHPAALRVRLVGLLVAGSGFLVLLSVLRPPHRIGEWLTGYLVTATGADLAGGGALSAGVAMVLLGAGVARRRRLALDAVLAVLVVATVAHLLRDADPVAAAITAAAAGLLLHTRRQLAVRVAPGRIVDTLTLAAILIGLDLGYGLLTLTLHRPLIRPAAGPGAMLAEVAARLIGRPGPLSIGGGFGDWFPGSLTLLGAVTIGALLVVLLAPVALPATPDSGGRELARRLMDRADADTLDPFVLRRDKRLLFSPDRRAVLAYRYVHGVGLATGDPAGDPDSSAGAVTSLLRTCASHGWRPAVVGVRADRLPGYAGLGLRSVYIGDEAVIDVPEFDLAGRRMRNARQAVTRSHNAGLSTTICRESALDPPLREELRDLAALARHGRREFGFSMALGDLLTGHYPDCLVIVCRDRGGRPVALQRYLPCRQGAALSLDAMRRLPDAPNGANERMIVDMVEWARAHRVAEVSLNFAAFRSILDPGVEHTPVQALTGRLMLLMDGRFGIQLDSLRAFNAKFAPRWVPRHLLYRAAADLPAVGLAALSAEGFLPLDGGRERPTRHEPGRRTARSTAR